MPRVQAIVVRGDQVLMVKHRQNGVEWWCLPGGRWEAGETPQHGALRELREECNIVATIIRQTAHVWNAPDDETYSFLVDIGDQAPSLGHDPDVPEGQEVLVDVQWRRLSEIPERDRAFLWAAGLLGVGDFFAAVERWGDATSCPDGEHRTADNGPSCAGPLS